MRLVVAASITVVLVFFGVVYSQVAIHAQEFVHPNELIIRGHLNAVQVEKALAPHVLEISICYEQLLKIDDKIQGKITLVYDVGTKGGADLSCSPKLDPNLSNKAFVNCVRKAACNARFPKPKIPTHIEYPLPLTVAAKPA